MKRSSISLDTLSSTSGYEGTQQQRSAPGSRPLRSYRDLNVFQAGQTAMELLNSQPPENGEFSRLLDEMHDQGIRELKLSGALNEAGYQVLVQELTINSFRLRDHIRGLDFSDLQLPQITTLLNLLTKTEHLESLSFSNVRFPPTKGDLNVNSEPVPLQLKHLALITDIVACNKNLRHLDLNDQPWLGSTVGLTNPRISVREATIYHLMEVCRGSRVQTLKFRHCNLSKLDINNIRAVLESDSHQNSRPCLRELDLSGNATASYQWEDFFYSIKGHKTLEKLSLPDEAGHRWHILDKEKKAELAQIVGACPQLKTLKPDTLAHAEEIYPLLFQRNQEIRKQHLMTAVLMVRSFPGAYGDIEGLAARAIAKNENLKPEEVLPEKFNFSPRPKDFEIALPVAPDAADDGSERSD